MKVLVLNNMTPFVWGDSDEFAATLTAKLSEVGGVTAELVRLPFILDPPEKVIDFVLSSLVMRLDYAERVIAFRFPSYLVQHTHKTLWLSHQHRQAYDLSGRESANFSEGGFSKKIRECIVAADNTCFDSCQHIFVNSRTTQSRLKNNNGFSSEFLMPPLSSSADFQCEGYGDYIFAGGRVSLVNRQHLLVEAMISAPKGCKLIVSGPVDTPSDGMRLENLIREHRLHDRVTLDLGFISPKRLASYVNGALACAYLPIDEDWVGHVTMEAFYASKAVITCVDSGGVLDLVVDGQTGIVAESNVHSISIALARMASDRATAKSMGDNASEAIKAISPNWNRTIDRLLA